MRFDIHRPRERQFENKLNDDNLQFFTLRKIKGGKWRLKSSTKNKIYSENEINMKKNMGIWREQT